MYNAFTSDIFNASRLVNIIYRVYNAIVIRIIYYFYPDGAANVAHEEIDLKNPKSNRGNPGFSDQERGKFSLLLESGFTDSFRYLYPELKDAYSWWSYRFNAREKNVGWRIDYFCVSDRIKDKIRDSKIHSEIYGSDHCPVELEIDL